MYIAVHVKYLWSSHFTHLTFFYYKMTDAKQDNHFRFNALTMIIPFIVRLNHLQEDAGFFLQ